MTKMLVIETNGNVYQKDMVDGEIGKVLGGWLEGLSLDHQTLAYVNEEGKQYNLPFNTVATKLVDHFRPGFAAVDVILGNVVVVGTRNPETNEHDGESYDCPEEIVNMTLEMSKQYGEHIAEQLAKELECYPWLASVGIGQSNGENTLYVYVKSEPTFLIQTEYYGIPLQVVNSGEFVPAVE